MKRALGYALISLLLGLFITVCGGGGGGGSNSSTSGITPPASVPLVSVIGNVDKISIALKPATTKTAKATSTSPLTSATVKAINESGDVAGTTTTDAATGDYTLNLPGSTTYVIKVSSGSVVLKAISSVGSSNATIDVNPASTATVKVLETKLAATLGTVSLGEENTDFTLAAGAVDVNTAVTTIASDGNFGTVANAVAAAVANNSDPLTDTAVTTAADTASAAVAVTANTTDIWAGKWTGAAHTCSGNTDTCLDVITVNSNGTWSGPKYDLTAKSSCTESGTWSLNGTTLTHTLTASSCGATNLNVPVSETMTISGNVMTLSSSGSLIKLGGSSTLVGTWNNTSCATSCPSKIYIYSDGTFKVTEFNQSGTSCNDTGMWYSSGTSLWHATLSSSCSSTQLNTETSTYTISGSTLSLSGGGNNWVLTKQ